jgi:hypothetical protein
MHVCGRGSLLASLAFTLISLRQVNSCVFARLHGTLVWDLTMPADSVIVI